MDDPYSHRVRPVPHRPPHLPAQTRLSDRPPGRPLRARGRGAGPGPRRTLGSPTRSRLPAGKPQAGRRRPRQGTWANPPGARRRGVAASWPAEQGARGKPRYGCEKVGVRARTRDAGRRSLTARSGWRQSRCDTARMTPARQPRRLRPPSRRSGRASSPTARHRNRFPTSSGRVSTAIAPTGDAAAAAASTARRPTNRRSYRPPMLRRADPRTEAAPRASADSGAHRTLCAEGTATSVAYSTLSCALRLAA